MPKLLINIDSEKLIHISQLATPIIILNDVIRLQPFVC